MAKQATPSAEAEAYVEDGRKVEIVSAVPGGYLVQQVYENDEWGPDYGKPFMVDAVWREPPVAIYEAKVSDAIAAFQKASADLQAQRGERAEFERAEVRIRENLRKHGLLNSIEAALEGRLTHAVFTDNWNGDVRVKTMAQVLKDRDSAWRLHPLTLEASLKNDGAVALKWVAHSSPIAVFTSEEDATIAAQALVGDRIKKLRADSNASGLEGLLASCLAVGLEQPADLVERHRASSESIWLSAVKRSEQELAVNLARLNQYLTVAPSVSEEA